MPNHVINRVTLKGSVEDIEKFWKDVEGLDPHGKESPFTFNKIIPMPKGLSEIDDDTLVGYLNEKYCNMVSHSMEYFIEGIKKAREDQIKNFCNAVSFLNTCGHASWYSWRIEHWGTKWDAYDFVANKEMNSFEFQTAWRTPLPIFYKMSVLYPNIVFDVKYADEDIGHNLGHITFQDWGAAHSVDIKEGTELAEKFACGLWGRSYEDYKKDCEEDDEEED